MRKNCLKSVKILVMLSMFMVAPNVASAITVIEYVQIMLELLSLTQCDQPIEDFDDRVLHENVTIESVYVNLTNSSKMQLHLKLDKNDDYAFGTARDVYVHKCIEASVGAALSNAGTLKGKIHTHAVVGVDSLGYAVLIRLSTGKSPMIPDPEN